MAWTLEAALVVPLAIGLTSLCVAYSAPLYRDACRAARLEVQAAEHRTSLASLYQADLLRVDGVWTVSLRTSPRMMLELGSLIQDDVRLLSSMFPGLGTSEQKDDSDALPDLDRLFESDENASEGNGALIP